jgi:BolA protein
MNAEDIVARILAAIPGARVETEGSDCSFSVRVVSQVFEGQNLLQRQRPILALFKEEISAVTLHALSIDAKTPDEAAS